MSKKFISVLVAAVMLCTIFTIGVFAADVNPGDTTQVTVSISGNPGVSYLKIRISYDNSVLTLTSADDAGLLKGYTPGQSISDNPFVAVWSNTTNVEGNGTIMTLTFDIKSDALDGNYPVTVEVAGANNQSEENVSVNVSASSINIKHEHKWDGGKVTKTATCAAEGERTLTCTVCGEKKTETIAKDASNHADYGTELKNAQAATETSKGYTGDKVCKGCGAVLEKGKDIEPLGHKHTLTKSDAKAPTCTEKGNIEYYTCSGCKKIFSDAAGTKEITDVTVPAKGHQYGEWKVEKEATETKSGLKSRVCKVCGNKEEKIIEPLGHKHTLTKTNAKAPTCTEKGNIEYYTCSGCKKIFSDKEGAKEINDVTVPAKGHQYGEWKVEKEATKTAEGLKTRVCKVCGNKEEKKIDPLPDNTTAAQKIYDIGGNNNGYAYVNGGTCGEKDKPAGKDDPTEKCAEPATAGKAPANVKTNEKSGAKIVKTDGGKNTGDNSVLFVVTGLLVLSGAAFVVTKKKRS